MIKDKRLKGKIGIEIKQDILENLREPVYLGIGSNIGNRINNINNACYLLRDFCTIIKISSIYETSSWPNKNFPKYLNIILKCNTKLDPFTLLFNIKKRNFPRTCDIDIIDYKRVKFKKKFVEVPHPRLYNRNFVLFPLFEIEKTWKHPKTKISIDKLLKNLDIKSLRGIKIL